jgi:hypothetical protein
MSQIWHHSEVVYRELLKIARAMLWRQVRRGALAIERYEDDIHSLALEVVIEMIERVLKLEQTRGPAANLMGRCYRVMYHVTQEKARDIWALPKTSDLDDFVDRETAVLYAGPDPSIETVLHGAALAELQRFVELELPSLYREAVDEVFADKANPLYQRPEFLPCAIDRLNGKPVREAWEAFSGLGGGSCKNMEKLYQAWRLVLRSRLKAIGRQAEI